jgi:arylsulfatase A-like enzyme
MLRVHMRSLLGSVTTGTALAVLLASCQLQPPVQPQLKQPNIVLFFVDDLGWQDVSEPFHSERTPWNERYDTPNVERLCREGTKFPHAYAHPVCTPSRVSLMTGMAAARHRVTHWTLNAGEPSDRQRQGMLRPDWNTSGLSNDPATPKAVCAETLAHRLKSAGYHTVLVGKSHLGAVGTPGANPRNLGFDVNVGGHAAGAPSSYLAKKSFLRRPNDTLWQPPGLSFYHGRDRFLTDVLTDEALAKVNAAHSREEPFFLYLTHYAVHTPLDPDDRFVGEYRKAGLSEPEARYAALVRGMDHSLGRVLDWLDEQSLADNTIVVFTSDNGGLSALARGGKKHTHNSPLKSGKGSAYEGGVRVPFAIRWPGHIAKDQSNTLPIQLEDLMPTLCDLANVNPNCPDGRSFARTLAGKPQIAHPLFFHHPHYWGATGPGIEPFSAVRHGDLKYIWFYKPARGELYDVVRDVGETNDLIKERPDDALQLRGMLRAHLTECDAQVPTRKDGLPVARP